MYPIEIREICLQYYTNFTNWLEITLKIISRHFPYHPSFRYLITNTACVSQSLILQDDRVINNNINAMTVFNSCEARTNVHTAAIQKVLVEFHFQKCHWFSLSKCHCWIKAMYSRYKEGISRQTWLEYLSKKLHANDSMRKTEPMTSPILCDTVAFFFSSL